MHGSRSQTYIYSIYKVTNKQKKEGIGQKIIVKFYDKFWAEEEGLDLVCGSFHIFLITN